MSASHLGGVDGRRDESRLAEIIVQCTILHGSPAAAVSLPSHALFLDDIAVVQVEGLSVSGLLMEIVLQFSPFAEVAAATAAMDGGMFRRVVRDIHLDRPARLAIELVIKPLRVHRVSTLLSAHFLASSTLTVQ